MLKLLTALTIALALSLSACSINISTDRGPKETRTIEKPFASGGKIEMQLAGGSYQIKPAAGDRIRVTYSGNLAGTKADVMTDGTRASITIMETPHNNFDATIEVPATTDLAVHLSAGDLQMAAIQGNKDIQSGAGNLDIAVGDPNDYATVDASGKAGDIDADVFGGSKSGILPHLTWSGPGKYTLRVSLGAGNLNLKK